MKKAFALSLSGDYKMRFIGSEPYYGEEAPSLEGGFVISGAVPAYFEDLMDEFRKNPIHTTLKYNPAYTLQRYPQAGYVPDMALPNISGCFAYQRAFSVDKSKLFPLCELRFGGVQNTASAWINGHFIGRHEGFSSDFSFEFSSDILSDGENEIVIAVSNTPIKGYNGKRISGCINRAANSATGGIYGELKLISHSGELEDFYLTVDENLEFFTVFASGEGKTERKLEIFDGGRRVVETVIPTGEHSVRIPTEGFKLWSPDEPKIGRAHV